MHSFIELIERSTNFTLSALKEAEDRVNEALQTSGATRHVKNLQMIRLQKAILAVGMFSIFESIIQDGQGCKDGFVEARQCLERENEHDLRRRFLHFSLAINVLKHGRGRSYNELLVEGDELPFRIKRPDEAFFSEGDVSEVRTLIEVDDQFVRGCAEVIREVSNVIAQTPCGAM